MSLTVTNISCGCRGTSHDSDCWVLNPTAPIETYSPAWDYYFKPTPCSCGLVGAHTIVTHWFQRFRRERWGGTDE